MVCARFSKQSKKEIDMKNLFLVGLALTLVLLCAVLVLDPAILRGGAIMASSHHFAVAMIAAPARSGLVGMTRRGIMSVRSEATNTEIMALLGKIQSAFDTFKTENDTRVSNLEKGKGDVLSEDKVNRINAAIDGLEMKLAALQLTGGNGGNGVALTAEQKAHSKAWNSYFRKGVDNGLRELEVKAALTSNSDPDGGYITPIEIELSINRILQKICVMRSMAQVVTISTGEYKKPTSQGGALSGWVGQQTARPATGTPTLTMETFKAHELYAQPAASQQLLDDSAVDVGSWLSDEVTITFAEQEGASFITGDGVTQPFGILSYGMAQDTGNGVAWGKVGFVKTTVAADFGANGGDNLIDLQSMLKTGYQPNASFLMNRFVQAEVRKFKDSQGRYLWEPALQAGNPPTIFGKPIAIDDNMPNAGANNFFVAYGDFRRAYLIVDRIGVRILRDPFTSKPNVLFYTTKRVGGGIQNYEAIKLLKCST
jgi:HK97 family phage major capsid protein